MLKSTWPPGLCAIRIYISQSRIFPANVRLVRFSQPVFISFCFSDEPPDNFQQFLEHQWNQSAQFLTSKAEHFDGMCTYFVFIFSLRTSTDCHRPSYSLNCTFKLCGSTYVYYNFSIQLLLCWVVCTS